MWWTVEWPFFIIQCIKKSQDSVDFTDWYLLCQPLLDCQFKAFPKSFLLAVVGTCKWQVECLQTGISRSPNYSALALDQQGVFSKMKVWKYLNFLRQYHFMIKFSHEESSFTIKAFLIQRMLLFSKVLDTLTSSSFKSPFFPVLAKRFQRNFVDDFGVVVGMIVINRNVSKR